MPHYTGHTTGICIAGDAEPRNFKAAGSYTTAKDHIEGIRYQSGTHTFFHPNNSLPGNYSAGLMKLNSDGTTEILPTGNAMSEYIKTDNGPSVFSLRFYKNLFKADSVYEDQ